MSIENTSRRDPLLHFAGLLGGSDRYIEQMEAAGQRQVVNSDVLPTDSPWDELATLGFVRGENVPNDDLFCNVTLPSGWRREGSDHAMWSYIVDERGIHRVAVFYKAAFYDRKAAAHIEHVGYSLASAAVYGDAAPSLPSQWDVLTEDERGEFLSALDGHMVQARVFESQYTVARVQALIDLTAATA